MQLIWYFDPSEWEISKPISKVPRVSKMDKITCRLTFSQSVRNYNAKLTLLYINILLQKVDIGVMKRACDIWKLVSEYGRPFWMKEEKRIWYDQNRN